MIGRNQEMTKSLSCKLVRDLHEGIFVSVAIAHRIAVLAVAKAIIQDARRSVGRLRVMRVAKTVLPTPADA